MEKRFQSVDNMVNVTVLIVLTGSQLQKLENKDLCSHIDLLAKDFHLDWAVETNGNVHIAALSRMCGPVVGSEIIHQIEIDATNFMSAVDKLELPTDDVIHFDDNTELDFVKQLLTDLNLPKEDEDSVIGAQILCYGPKNIPFPLPWGKMSHNLLKEMCELYVEKYGNK